MSGPAALLAGILPGAVAVCETYGDLPGARLLPAERETAAARPAGRGREFTTDPPRAPPARPPRGHPPPP
ncbi:4'-phosphopantetheinyl transferase, partial [Streptomyces albidoflavus]